MALTKMVDGVSIPLTDLEEKAELLRWKMGDHEALKPMPLAMQEEHEMLVKGDAAGVIAARADYATKLSVWEKEHQPFVDAYQDAGAWK